MNTRPYHISILLIIFVFIVPSNCMDAERFSYTLQRQITIPLSDGDYKLEQWKIYACNNLYKHCLQHDKNFESSYKSIQFPRFDNVCIKEMKLISTALDKNPGDEMLDHIQSLSPVDRYILVVASGKQDDKHKKKMYVPSLIAQITGVIVPGEIHERIKSHLYRGNWINRCYNGIVKDNITASIFPNFLWKPERDVIRQNNGTLNYVPKCWAQEKSLLFNGPRQAVALPVDAMKNIKWPTYCSKILSEILELRVTGTDSCGDDEFPQVDGVIRYLVRVLSRGSENTQQVLQQVLVEHKEEIKDVVFDYSGKRVISYSKNELFITAINTDGADTFLFETKKVCFSGEITAVCFHHRFPLCVVCCFQDNKSQMKLFDTSGNCIAEVELQGYIDKALFNHAGNRLLTCSINDHGSVLSIWDTHDVRDIKILFNKTISEQQTFNLALCSPMGIFWTITTLNKKMYCIKEIYNEFFSFNISMASDDKDIERIAYSSDGDFLITINSVETNDTSILRIWNINTNCYVVDRPIVPASAIGIASQDRELLFCGAVPYKMPFLSEENKMSVELLQNNATFLRCMALRRLCKARENDELAVLYKEEPMYKALQTLPTKPYDLVSLVKKYLPYTVVNNNKDIGEVYDDVALAVSNWWKSQTS